MDKLQKEAKRQHMKQGMVRGKHPRLHHCKFVCRVIYEKPRVDPEKNNQIRCHEQQPQRRATPFGKLLPAAFRHLLVPCACGLPGKARAAVADDDDKKDKRDEAPRGRKNYRARFRRA